MPIVQSEANFSYSYLYEQSNESELRYVVLGFESQVQSDDIDCRYVEVLEVLNLEKEAFWSAGKTYSDVSGTIEYTPLIQNNKLALGTYQYLVASGTSFVPVMSSHTQSGFTASASHQYSNYYVWKLFDGQYSNSNDSKVWSGGFIGPNAGPWVQIQCPSPKKLGRYAIRAHYLNPEQPKTWKIEGSNNGTSWTILHQVTNAPAWSGTERRVYDVFNETEYTYFRMTIIQNQGDNWQSFSDWELMEITGTATEEHILWVSYPIDLTKYNIEPLSSIVAKAFCPGSSQLKLYVASGNSKAEVESAGLNYISDIDALIDLNISGSKWIIIAIEYVGG